MVTWTNHECEHVLHMWKHVIPGCKDTGAMVFSIKLFSGYWTLCQHGLVQQSLRTRCLMLPEFGRAWDDLLRMHFLKADQKGFRTPWNPEFSTWANAGVQETARLNM